jgi:hypothetical protein
MQNWATKTKKPAIAAGLVNNISEDLLDLCFLVHDVLAHDRIVLFHLQFTGRVFLVFIGRVKVTGTC